MCGRFVFSHGLEVVKLFMHNQLSMQLQLLLKAKMPKKIKKTCLAFKLSDVVFIMLIMLKCQQLLAF